VARWMRRLSMEVAVILQTAPGDLTAPEGLEKMPWLMMLCASTRNCEVILSSILTSLNDDRSNDTVPRPRPTSSVTQPRRFDCGHADETVS